MDQYLESSEYIDWRHPAVLAKAAELAEDFTVDSQSFLKDEGIAKRCFEFVRDSIKHSWDHRQNPVTCRASDVLLYGTGYSYTKSHLLAALLRANGIPAGLCYQRLQKDTYGAPFSLHGLNAVHLEKHGWYRIDARGNRPGVEAEFCPPVEKLAFSIIDAGEMDIPEIRSDPLALVIYALTKK